MRNFFFSFYLGPVGTTRDGPRSGACAGGDGADLGAERVEEDVPRSELPREVDLVAVGGARRRREAGEPGGERAARPRRRGVDPSTPATEGDEDGRESSTERRRTRRW